MCRIAAIISKNNTLLQQGISAMTDAMHRGGPDDNGVLINKIDGYALGHRRLSIIDLSPSGHQPMIDDLLQIEITYNGEIYNYISLKKELETLGYTFFSESDTEILIKGYDAWGTTILLNKLRGMFAFVMIDKKKSILFAARDHAGIKPLYIARNNESIIFSSEIRGIKALDENWAEYKNWAIWFLTFGFLPEPITTLDNVKPLPRGHFITINLKTKEEKIESYCKYNYNNLGLSYDEAKIKTKELLINAVKRHLVADVPVGVFLSGGIDSSILTIIAQEQITTPIETISIYFDDEKFSEKEYQDIIIRKTGVKHHTHKITKEDFISAWDEIYESIDQPSVDAINSHFICKYAKKNGLKVVLSGLGADEIFGGYPSINRINKLNSYKRLAILNNLLGGKLFGAAYPKKKIEFLNKKINASEYLLYRGMFAPSDTANILGITENEVWKELSKLNFQENIQQLHPQNRATYYETSIYMQSQLLKDSDVQSMWYGLELRVPFLDRDLMDFVNNLSPEIKFLENQNKPKPLLVDAFINELPEAIWNRPKKGFTFPFENWFKTMNIFKNEAILPKKFLKAFKQNRITYSRALAILLTRTDKTRLGINDLSKLNYKPNILFTYLTTFKESGGIQKVNKIMLKAMPLSGKNVVEAYGVYDKAVDTNYFPAYAYKSFNGNKAAYFFHILFNSLKWKQVIVGHINLATVIRILKYINPKIKISLIVHGIEVWDKQTKSKKWILENANQIISVSHFTKNSLIKVNKVDENKIEVLPNCLDPFFEKSFNSLFNINSGFYLKDRYKISPNTKIVLTVSRIKSTEKYKGYDKVLEALSLIKQKNTIDFIYLLCGSYDEKEYARVKEIICNLNLEKNVLVPGFIADSELINHYKLADVFIMPSKKEGFGIVFIEAASCGVNVIAGNKDGSVEAMLDGELGQLVDPDSVNEIYDALLLNLLKPTEKNSAVAKNAIAHYNFEAYQHHLNNMLFSTN